MQVMKFKDRFIIDNYSIKMFKGHYRDKPWFETCIEGNAENAEMIKQVYSVLEMVYNTGEHEGRFFVRENIKAALGLDL